MLHVQHETVRLCLEVQQRRRNRQIKSAITFEYPKSQIFRRGRGLPSSSVFSSLMSLLATPWPHRRSQYDKLESHILRSLESQTKQLPSNAAAPGVPHHSVEIVNTDYQLLEEPSGLALSQAPFSDHILEHVSTRDKLHGNCQVMWREKHLDPSKEVVTSNGHVTALLIVKTYAEQTVFGCSCMGACPTSLNCTMCGCIKTR